MPRLNASIQERLLADSEPIPFAGCRIWLKALDRDGYGVTTVDGKTVAAHRASFEAFVGPIPPGHHVDHYCNTRPCIEPSHLQACTPADNNRFIVARGRFHPKDQHGVLNGLAKLDDLKVLVMRAMRSSGASLRDFADWAGVSVGTAHPAVSGRTWSHLNSPQ